MILYLSDISVLFLLPSPRIVFRQLLADNFKYRQRLTDVWTYDQFYLPVLRFCNLSLLHWKILSVTECWQGLAKEAFVKAVVNLHIYFKSIVIKVNQVLSINLPVLW